MPIKTLQFNCPDEENEFLFAINGGKYWSALFDISQWIRSFRKSEVNEITIEELRKEFYSILESCGVNLDEIS